MPKSRAFRAIEYPIVGGSYKDASKPLSQQRTLNMYLEVTKSGRSDAVLKSWRGLSLKESGDSDNSDRGIYNKTFQGFGFQVVGSTLYRFDQTFVRNEVGTISGVDQVTFADNGVILVIVGGNTAYQYDGDELTTISLDFTPTAVAFLNKQFFYTSDSDRVYISGVGEVSVSAGNNFIPDSSSDELVRAYIFDQFVLACSSDTIEPWENTGVGLPPVERMTGVIQEKTGLVGKDAISNTSKAVYFLGSDNEPYQMVNFQARKIGDPAVSREIQSYSKTDDCRVFVLDFGSQDFIQFHFPFEEKTWLFCEQTGIWSELTHGADEQRYIGNSVAFLFGSHLVGGAEDSNLYCLEEGVYQNNGVLMARERIARPLSGENFNNPRQRLQFSEVRFSVGTGVGTSEEVNPIMESEISVDGVKFGNSVFHELGREGEYQQDIYHSTNVNCTDLVVKVRCTDNCDFAIYGAGAFVREAGK